MKKIYLLSIIFVFHVLSYGQILSPTALVSSGGNFANSSAQISWTLGDFQTKTYAKETLLLTQGFLQSNITVTSVLELDNSEKIHVNVYPNPVSTYVNMEIINKDNKKLSWQLINQSGNIIKIDDINNTHVKIDFRAYQTGVYYLKTFSKDGTYLKIFKILRIN